jgi:polar amino acid transport system substrate-binding protein
MKRLALLGLLSLAMIAGSPAHAQDATVKIGTEGTYAPFSYFTSDGKLTGFDVELTQALCDTAKVRCEFLTLEYEGLLEALQKKKIDAIAAGMNITEKRKKFVAFTDSYRSSDKRFVSCKPDQFQDVSPEALKSRIIGAQSGTTSIDYFNTYYAGADIRRYKSMDEAFQDLAAGRIELAMASEPVGYSFINTPGGKGCAFVGPRLKDEKLFGSGVGLALRKDDEGLVENFNRALRAIRDNGTYEAINKKYFPFSVY